MAGADQSLGRRSAAENFPGHRSPAGIDPQTWQLRSTVGNAEKLRRWRDLARLDCAIDQAEKRLAGHLRKHGLFHLRVAAGDGDLIVKPYSQALSRAPSSAIAHHGSVDISSTTNPIAVAPVAVGLRCAALDEPVAKLLSGDDHTFAGLIATASRQAHHSGQAKRSSATRPPAPRHHSSSARARALRWAASGPSTHPDRSASHCPSSECGPHRGLPRAACRFQQNSRSCAYYPGSYR